MDVLSRQEASGKAADGFAVDTNAPDWKDAPEWAQWVAQDEDGDWYWYENKPRLFDKHWMIDGGKTEFKFFDIHTPDWRETLQERTKESNDWIEWHGGECPVNGAVQVRLREGTVLNFSDASIPEWQHENN